MKQTTKPSRKPKQKSASVDDVKEILVELSLLQEDVERLYSALHSYSYDEEAWLYVPEESPEEIYKRELGGILDSKTDAPEVWDVLFKDNLDPETLAFFCLDDHVKKNLVN